MKHQCDTFHVFADNDESIRRALECVERAAVDKLKVCVVSIIGRVPLDSAVNFDMINALLGRKTVRSTLNHNSINNNNCSPAASNNSSQQQQQQAKDSDDELTSDASPAGASNHLYENQVVGLLDTKASIIVLQLSSIIDSNHLQSLVDKQKDFFKDETLLQGWPQLNQNLVKTLLILYLLSHIVVIYSPEPSFDAQSIRLFRVLEDLRKRSQPRVCDLLEVVGGQQIFPQFWIKSGRLCCPRTLFVFDATQYPSCLDISQAERNLEDHIYKLLRKSGIISKQTNDASSLFCLPPRDNYVYLVTKDDACLSSSNWARSNCEREKKVFDTSFYDTLLMQLATPNDRKLGLSSIPSEIFNYHEGRPEDESVEHNNKFNNNNTNNNDNTNKSNSKQSSSANGGNRFRKFLKLHIDQALRATSVTSEHGSTSKSLMAGPQTRQAAFTLPRIDNFLRTLIKIKNLMYPPLDNSSIATTQTIQTTNISNNHSNCDIWRMPDERRFVDIYDLFDTDKVFSEIHCIKVYNASLELYIRGSPQCYDSKYHQNKSDLAKKFYAIHARGPSYHVHLSKLMEQCELIWNDGHRLCEDPGCYLYTDKPKGTCNNPQHQALSTPNRASLPNGTASKRHHHRNASNANTNTNNSNVAKMSQDDSSINKNSSNNRNNRATFDHHSMHIMRNQTGVRFTTSCECGRKQTFVITPKDKKKKLERIDIDKLTTNNDP